MTKTSLKITIGATIIAAVAMAAAVAPAFAWGSGAPDNYYGQTAQASGGYYDYAPGAITQPAAHRAHSRKHDAR